MRRWGSALGLLLSLVPAASAAQTAPSVGSVSWAPGGEIAFTTGEIRGTSGVFVISPSGGSPRRIARSGSGVAWSRSGELAFNGDKGLFLARPDGSGPHLLKSNGFLMSWSPDGNRLLYVTLEGELRMIRRDGTGDVGLTTIHTEAPEAVWSPDGTSIAFLDCRIPGSFSCGHAVAWDVYTLRLTGRNRRKRVTRKTIVLDSLAWAPGRQIAFHGEHGIYVGNRLTIRNAEAPSWSPDGRWLAASGPRALIVAHGDGSGRHRAAGFRKRDFVITSRPAWSPDSRQIAFAWPGPVSRPTSHLYVARASGGGLRRLA